MIRIGVVDSGIEGTARARVVAARDFPAQAASCDPRAGEPRDRCGHGSQVAAVLATAGDIELLDARVMFESLRSSASQVAAAIDWLLAEKARVINLSMGLREDRAVLREACVRAVRQNVLLIASSPARGAPIYPAAYDGVIRATGDARCAPGEISALDTPQADFGGHVRSADGMLAGASIGCAHVCARLAAWLAQHCEATRDEAIVALQAMASYCGAERHLCDDAAK